MCCRRAESHLSEVNVHEHSVWGISVEGAFVLRLQHNNCCHSWDLSSTVLGLILLLSSFPRFPAPEWDVFIPVSVFIFSCYALVPGVSPDDEGGVCVCGGEITGFLLEHVSILWFHLSGYSPTKVFLMFPWLNFGTKIIHATSD